MTMSAFSEMFTGNSKCQDKSFFFHNNLLVNNIDLKKKLFCCHYPPILIETNVKSCSVWGKISPHSDARYLLFLCDYTTKHFQFCNQSRNMCGILAKIKKIAFCSLQNAFLLLWALVRHLVRDYTAIYATPSDEWAWMQLAASVKI